MSLLETLLKPFLPKTEIDKDSSVTSKEPDIDIILDYNQDLPSMRGKFGYDTARQKIHDIQVDAYIRQYRRMSIIPEVSYAIDEIQNEALGIDLAGLRVPDLSFQSGDGNPKTDKSIQKKVADEWNEIMSLLKFQTKGKDIFRQWYVDGRIIAELVIDNKTPNSGIKQILILSPYGFRKMYRNTTGNQQEIYFKYDSINRRSYVSGTKEEFKKDQIVLSTSGIKFEGVDVGYLFPAVKVANNLVMVEDSLLIYRVLRAIETRIWNVNIGKMPTGKANNYLAEVINSIKSDITYDSHTGEFKGYSDIKSLINDFVFPVRGGTETTKVDTIGGNTNFVETTEDLKVFLRKLYLALKIPVNRLDDANTLDYGAEDILRSEEKFIKTVAEIQTNFSQFLLELLYRQCLLKKIVASESEWNEILKELVVVFQSFGNNQIIEKARMNSMLKKAETMKELEDSGAIGKVLSYEYVIKNVWNMTKEEYMEQRKLIEKEKLDEFLYPKTEVEQIDDTNEEEPNDATNN